MREIGSEFWCVQITDKRNQIFPETTQWYLSGRSALQAIVKELKWVKTVSIPSWCCDSIIKPFADAGIAINFYPVFEKGHFVQEINTDSDVLFIMDYFGYTGSITHKHSCTIRDMTHSIFSAKYADADYYFGSLRKWCGVWTGGYVWTEDGHRLLVENTDGRDYVRLRKRAMGLKNNYINNYTDSKGRYVTDKGYLKIYNEAEKLLDNAGIISAADRDVFVAERLDSEFIKQRRRENAKILMDAFPEMLVIHQFNEMDCPMFVPIFVPDGKRDKLRSFLTKHDIYCPVHWPMSHYHCCDEITKELCENELSLVCDQRYSKEDMYRMVEIMKTFLKEK